MSKKTVEKSIKLPEPGELFETTDEICSHCGYHQTLSNTLLICDYYLMTHKMRGCKSGTCNKFEKTAMKNAKTFGHF